MSEIAIRVENLSKLYRIGTQEGRSDTLAGALGGLLKAPERNLRRLARLSRFKDEDAEDVLWALRDVSFEVHQGEVLGVIGRNGAGKSTLLKLLSRITYPTRGRIEILGRVSSLLEVGTGFHPELTGRENIYLNGTILGMTRREIDRKFDEIVDFSGVEKFLDTPVKRYSSGMRVRLAFSVAAHLEPEVLLIDEVLAVGDSEFQKKCLGKMGDVAQEGRTVLFVSHQMAAVQHLCNRCLILKNGRIVANGETNAMISRYMADTSEIFRISLSDRQDRKGSGQIRFTEVRLKNARNEIVGSFRTGDDCILELRVENSMNLGRKKFHVAVGIDDPIGQRITLLNNETTDQLFPLISPGVSIVQIRIERLPLKPGRYGFSLFSAVEGEIADWIKNGGFFDVEGGDYYGTGKLTSQEQGTFLLNCNFSMTSDLMQVKSDDFLIET